MMIKFEGKTINLTQDPYIDGTAGERPVYKAHGTDAEGKHYLVTWNVVDGYEKITDESDMCEWDKPLGVMSL